jgi:hypothetical protein
MIKAITRLIIASASLWLALPAVAQFEIDPDHFDDPTPTVVQPRPEQSRVSMRTSLPYKQVQGHRVQAFKVTRSSKNTLQKLSNAAAVQQRSVSRTGRFGQEFADRKRSQQSRLASSLELYFKRKDDVSLPWKTYSLWSLIVKESLMKGSIISIN